MKLAVNHRRRQRTLPKRPGYPHLLIYWEEGKWRRRVVTLSQPFHAPHQLAEFRINGSYVISAPLSPREAFIAMRNHP